MTELSWARVKFPAVDGLSKADLPTLHNWKIGMILLKNRKEIAFPIGVCSKIILKNRKILSKPIETWAGNGQNSDSFLQIHNGWEVC